MAEALKNSIAFVGIGISKKYRGACDGALFSPARFPLSYGAFNTFGLAGKNLLNGENSRCYGTLDPLYSLRCAFHRDKGESHGRVS